jgi:hypothetical protein
MGFCRSPLLKIIIQKGLIHEAKLAETTEIFVTEAQEESRD